MPVFEIICLASSRKRGGWCIAGLRSDGQGWLRPVGLGSEGTLYPAQFTLTNGTRAQVLDTLRVGVSHPLPKPHQPENWQLDGTRWELVARPPVGAALPALEAAVRAGPTLLGSLGSSVPCESFTQNPASASLTLVRPRHIHWVVEKHSKTDKWQTRVRFDLEGGAAYDLSVTDPAWQRRMIGRAEGAPHSRDDLGIPADADVLLTVSLGEPYNDRCYKLTAAVIVLPPRDL